MRRMMPAPFWNVLPGVVLILATTMSLPPARSMAACFDYSRYLHSTGFATDARLPMTFGTYRDYFLMAHTVGEEYEESWFTVYEISPSGEPLYAGGTDLREWPEGRIETAGRFAYVLHDIGVEVIDMSNPHAPVGLGLDQVAGGNDIEVLGDYAYVIDHYLDVLDISDPRHPAPVAHINGGGWGMSLDLQYPFAYVADGPFGLSVFNIADPENPRLLTTVDTLFQARDVEAAGDFAYVADGASGIVVFDISNPLVPSMLGSVDVGGANQVAVDGYLYVAAGAGVVMLDISDPADPVIVGRLPALGCEQVGFVGDYVGYANTTTFYLAVRGQGPAPPAVGGIVLPNTLNLAIEGNRAYLPSSGGLSIVDVTNPSAPGELTFLPIPADCQGADVHANLCCVAADSSGFHVIDVGDPGNPRMLGTITTGEDAMGVRMDSGLAYAIDYESFLILDPPGLSLVSRLIDLGGWPRALDVSNGYAYVVGYGDLGLTVIDVRDPRAPHKIASAPIAGVTGYGVSIEGAHAFVACGSDGIQAFDVSIPALPARLPYYEPCDSYGVDVDGLDVYVTGGHGISLLRWRPDLRRLEGIGNVDAPGWDHHIVCAGGYAFVQSRDHGMEIVQKQCAPAPVIDSPGRVRDLCVAPNPCPSGEAVRLLFTGEPASAVAILDVQGRIVRTLDPGTASRASELVWDTRDQRGNPVAEGCYFVRRSQRNQTQFTGIRLVR